MATLQTATIDVIGGAPLLKLVFCVSYEDRQKLMRVREHLLTVGPRYFRADFLVTLPQRNFGPHDVALWFTLPETVSVEDERQVAEYALELFRTIQDLLAITPQSAVEG